MCTPWLRLDVQLLASMWLPFVAYRTIHVSSWVYDTFSQAVLFAFTSRCKLYLGQNCQARGGWRIAAQVTQVAMRDIATDHAHTAILFHNRSRHKKVAMIGDHSILNLVYDLAKSRQSFCKERYQHWWRWEQMSSSSTSKPGLWKAVLLVLWVPARWLLQQWLEKAPVGGPYPPVKKTVGVQVLPLLHIHAHTNMYTLTITTTCSSSTKKGASSLIG